MSMQRSQKAEVIGYAGARRQRKPLIDGFRIHRVGVEIDSRIEQRTWYEFGKLIQTADYARDWVISDWLAFGEHRYGDKIYQLASRLLGKSPRTWEDYAYVARNVRTSERSEILPTLVHRPVARFSDDPALQRKLIAIAEQHALSKATFETVIELYLQGKRYEHVLPQHVTPVERARVRAQKERERVIVRARKADTAAWVAYAREQAEGWSRVLEELEETSNAAAAKQRAKRRLKPAPRARAAG